MNKTTFAPSKWFIILTLVVVVALVLLLGFQAQNLPWQQLASVGWVS